MSMSVGMELVLLHSRPVGSGFAFCSYNRHDNQGMGSEKPQCPRNVQMKNSNMHPRASAWSSLNVHLLSHSKQFTGLAVLTLSNAPAPTIFQCS